ncbi:N-acetylmannosamine-6-phosphate 2-epimerase [Nonomuraea sp. NPDC052265]|uniref:N-acetylmannosamine-6-phosphate 2-epimerase n=1 Tax=Nonomuraea sp. NPDC052265 TaxID=3364374 RepID=UPI0037C9D92F
MDVVTAIEGGLVVSCQAPEGHPLRDPRTIALLARCAELGGAAGLRVNGPEDVRAVKAVSRLPLIGLAKVPRPHARPLITPSFALCEDLVRAGADMVALEVTAEAEPQVGDLPALVERVRGELGVPVMADVSTAEEGLRAWDRGASLISTTLSGYTPYTTAHPPTVPLRTTTADPTAATDPGPRTGSAPGPGLAHEPDLDLVSELAALGIRTVAEGRLRTDAHVAEAFARGAWSVVIGGAITDPLAITRHLTAATPKGSLR